MPRLFAIALLIALAPAARSQAIGADSQPDSQRLTPQDIDALIRLAEGPDAAQSIAAVARLAVADFIGNNPSIDPALAALYARSVAVGDRALARRIDEAHVFGADSLAKAMRTALLSSHTRTEELNLLKALGEDARLESLPATNP